MFVSMPVLDVVSDNDGGAVCCVALLIKLMSRRPVESLNMQVSLI